jgi:hypothetical protein
MNMSHVPLKKIELFHNLVHVNYVYNITFIEEEGVGIITLNPLQVKQEIVSLLFLFLYYFIITLVVQSDKSHLPSTELQKRGQDGVLIHISHLVLRMPSVYLIYVFPYYLMVSKLFIAK